MKKTALVLALSLVASSAFALVDQDNSSFGIYFDNAGDLNCGAPAPFTPFNLYFIIANPEVQNMGGFEFQWRLNPQPAAQPIISSFTLPPNALNIGTNYNVIVGLGSGMITSEATVVATANMLLLAAMDPSTYIQVGPATPASHPGHAAYNNFNDPAQIIDLNFSTVNGNDVTVDPNGWVVPGVFKFSCPAPIATETESWSGVKALFE
jgi:hypothetical protein